MTAAVLGTLAAAAVAGVPGAVLVLHAIALAGLAAAWLKARRALAAAETASAEVAALSNRMLQLEFRLAQPGPAAPDPALRSTVAEVTGEIGVLGGLVRDLAETVAAQDRDVAHLKERLGPAAQPSSRTADLDPAQPEPSLLPTARRDPRSRAGRERPGPATEAQAPPPASEPAMTEADARRLAAALHAREPALSDADARRMASIVEAFEADRIELHLQPVVALPQRTVRFYEALARLRLADESVLAPAEFLPLLERLGHAVEFDRRVLGRAMAVARHLMARGSEANVSVNLSRRAVDEPGFLRSVGRTLEASPETVGRVVFELSQRCWRTLDAERAGGLALLRDKGVPFALDRATDLRLDPLALAERGVRFVKVPADLLLAADEGQGLDIEVSDLAAVLRRAGIKLVAERVEREEIVPDLLDLDVPLAQGFVFSAPRAVRAEVLTPPAAGGPSAAAGRDDPPSDPEPPPGGGRLPYRSFLRRAT